MTVRLYLARLSRKNGQKYWGHEFDLTGLRDVIDHVTVGSAYPEYPTLEPNPKWIRCSVAKIYPCKDAELWTPPDVAYARTPRPWHNDTPSETKALLMLS